MPMSAEDFKAVSDVARDNLQRSTPVEMYRMCRLVHGVANMFATSQPDFDRPSFLVACGLTSDGVLPTRDFSTTAGRSLRLLSNLGSSGI